MPRKKKENTDGVIEFYKLDDLMKVNAQYYIAFGKRSAGKTYDALLKGLTYCLKTGKQMGYIKRSKMDSQQMKIRNIFKGVLKNTDLVNKMTKGKYKEITYYQQAFYYANYDEKLGKYIRAKEPFCHYFNLEVAFSNKSGYYEDIDWLIFDEFIPPKGQSYLENELNIFFNLVSTIKRNRTNLKIFLLGNTEDLFSPYFFHLGLNRVKDMKKGTIDTYTYGDSNLKVRIEYTADYNQGTELKKESDAYFAFGNDNLKMITEGDWVLNAYPLINFHIDKKEIIYTFYIIFQDNVVRCNVLIKDNDICITAHRTTKEIKPKKNELIYVETPQLGYNYRVNLYKRYDKPSDIISTIFKRNKVFYQDNTIGEIINSYIVSTKNK